MVCIPWIRRVAVGGGVAPYYDLSSVTHSALLGSTQVTELFLSLSPSLCLSVLRSG